MSEVSNHDSYAKVIERLTEAGARFREVEHAAEGRTDVISQIRGNHPRQAAKAIVVLVIVSKIRKRYVLAVVPGDCRLDLNAIRSLYGAERAMFAPADRAEQLTRSVMGGVPPFAFTPELDLVVDPSLVANDEIVFNAGRLDRSIFVAAADFLRAAKPRISPIAIA